MVLGSRISYLNFANVIYFNYHPIDVSMSSIFQLSSNFVSYLLRHTHDPFSNQVEHHRIVYITDTTVASRFNGGSHATYFYIFWFFRSGATQTFTRSGSETFLIGQG